MSTNETPFSPPLTAQEQVLWDTYVSAAIKTCAPSYAWKDADAAIHERRRRFGAPKSSEDVQPSIGDPATDKWMFEDRARAEIQRLMEERDQLRREQDIAIQRAEKAEAELAAVRPVLEAVVRWFSERAWTVKDADTLRDYAMSQRAARAAKEGGAS